jgi:tetratricopeptide (TPR) repeat protein
MPGASRGASGAEKVLRRGLAVLPRDADLHHALGLSLTRKGEQPAALQEFAEAARLAPDNARYAYVQAIAVHSAGKREQALALLRSANKRHPERSRHPRRCSRSVARRATGSRAALCQAARRDVAGQCRLNRLIGDLEGRQIDH